jgi:glutamate 5-kinase
MLSPSKRPLARPIVVKIGTAALTDSNGLPDGGIMAPLVRQLAELRQQGKTLVLVTSGAVGMGRHKLGWDKSRKLTDSEKSLAASVGQPYLMRVYADYFESFGLLPPGQILAENKHYANGDDQQRWNLLDYFDLAFRTPRFIPIVNENDVLSRVEIKPLLRDETSFSDNDGQASLLARLLNARQTVTISTHCVHTGNPCDPSAVPLPYINFISKKQGLEGLGIRTDGFSCGGTGGMENKIEAIRQFVQSGEESCGRRQAYIIDTVDLKLNGLVRAVQGQPVGTKLVCQRSKATRRKFDGTPLVCTC